MYCVSVDCRFFGSQFIVSFPVYIRFIAGWNISAVGHQFQSATKQTSSLFDVSSLPRSHHKSMSPGLFGAGDDSTVSKSGKFYIRTLSS